MLPRADYLRPDRAADLALPAIGRVFGDGQQGGARLRLAPPRAAALQHLADGQERHRARQPRQLDVTPKVEAARGQGEDQADGDAGGGGHDGQAGAANRARAGETAALRPIRLVQPGGSAGDDRSEARSEASGAAGARPGAVPVALFASVLRDPASRQPRGYIIPSDQADFPTATKFVNALLKTGITVHRASAAFAVGGRVNVPAGFVDRPRPRSRSARNGGTILAVGRAGLSLAGLMDLPVENHLVERAPDGSSRPLPSEKFYVPGSVVRVAVDTTAPIAHGIASQVDMFFYSPAFRLEPQAALKGVRPAAWFDTPTPLRSGWAVRSGLFAGRRRRRG